MLAFFRRLFGRQQPAIPPIVFDSQASRREVVIGVLAAIAAPACAARTMDTVNRGANDPDPFYAKNPPPEETVFWSKADKCYVWVSKPLGADEREWIGLAFSIKAGVLDSNPAVSVKGSRIRMFLAYDSPEGIGLGSIISAATAKSIYAEPQMETYSIASVRGMDAGRRSRLYVASEGPFSIWAVHGTLQVTPEVVERYRKENPDAGSMPQADAVQDILFFDKPGRLGDGITTEKYLSQKFPAALNQAQSDYLANLNKILEEANGEEA